MAVGPSGFDLIQKLGYVETVAQFGSIFLLFSHGLMYSELYADAAAAPTAPTPRSSGSSAFTCVTVMCGLLAALARGSGLASTPLESFLVALAVALSSTSTVLTTLSQARDPCFVSSLSSGLRFVVRRWWRGGILWSIA